MSRILVTGINSPLGQAVGRKLKAEEHTVVGTVRSSKIITQGLPADELIPLDLESKDTFDNISGSFDAIIHVASISLGSPEEFLRINSTATGFLIERAQALDIGRLIYVSSMAIYGDPANMSIDEFTEIQSQSSYGGSKWQAEVLIQNAFNTIPTLTLRPPAIVGPITNYHFLSKVIQKMKSQEPFINVSNPDFLSNNVVHQNVIADFLCTLTEKKSLNKYRAVPIGSTDPIPLREIIDVMAKATNYKGQINWVEPKTPPFRIDSTGAIELGYQPITTLETVNRWMHDAR